MPFVKDGIAHLTLQKSPRHERWFALLDLEDYERVQALNTKWMGVRSGRTIYVRATSGKYLAGHHMQLHAFVMKAKPGERYDHENNNGLDCRKANLRLATPAENGKNKLKTNSQHVTSRFKGVRITSSGRWGASIGCDDTVSVLGLFDDEEDAARAYDEAALQLFGAFAKTNEMLGLFDPRPTPIAGRVKLGTDLGPFISREAVLGAAEREPWEQLFVDDPERRNFEPVVGLTQHKRSKAVLYRLRNGQCVYPESYAGPPITPEEMARMRAEFEMRLQTVIAAKRLRLSPRA